MLMLYNYLNNIGHANLKAMRQGMWHGLKEGWAMRRQAKYKVPANKRSTWNLMRSMSWNPVILSNRGVHVRAL